MTPRGLARAVAFIALRWVYPDLTTSPEACAALGQDLAGYDDAEVIAALERLVTEGHKYQPRGPAIVETITRMRTEQLAMRRSLEADERAASRLKLDAERSAPPAELAETLARIRRRP